jgi:hypothetical protein
VSWDLAACFAAGFAAGVAAWGLWETFVAWLNRGGEDQ